MKRERFETGKAPELQVQCQGDLIIKGWAEPVVSAAGDNFEASEGEGSMLVQGNGDLSLMVPAAAMVDVLHVTGDLTMKGVAGSTTIGDVAGDVFLRNLGPVEIRTISGNLACRDIDGALSLDRLSGDAVLRNVRELHLDEVGGDAVAVYVNGSVSIAAAMGDVSLRTVNGDLTVSKAHRDVNVRNLGGVVKLAAVMGDIRLRGALGAGKHSMYANGDIVVRWPMDAPLNLEATSASIQRGFDMLDMIVEDGFLSGRLGDGECFLMLESKGRIILKDIPMRDETWRKFDESEFDFGFGVDLSGIGERIASEVSSRMDDWSKGFEREFGPEFAARIDRTSQEAAAKAERAARKAEKAIRKVRWQIEPGSWTAVSAGPPRAGNPGKSKERAATDAEQLKILRMVENGVISPEEASTLLEAIEG